MCASRTGRDDVYDEEALLPISALQHLVFCVRQCALIHVEGLWAENRLTVEGAHLHERVDSGEAETRGPVRTARRLAIRSLRLGIAGYADVVEFHRQLVGATPVVLPIEFKRGRPKTGDEDRVQLCAEALCLEEMLELSIRTGILFYGETRRRVEVAFDEPLRTTTELAVERLHALIRDGRTPPPEPSPKCDQCSLVELCMPRAVVQRRSARRYVERDLWIEAERGER